MRFILVIVETESYTYLKQVAKPGTAIRLLFSEQPDEYVRITVTSKIVLLVQPYRSPFCKAEQ